MITSLRIWFASIRQKHLPSGSLSSRFARGAFWSLIGMMISQALALGASIVTARLLGKVGLGELGMINSTVGLFGTFAGLGLGLTATKYVAQFRQHEPERASKILGLSQLTALVSGGSITLVLFIFAPTLAAQTLNAPHLGNILRLGCGLLFVNALNGAQTGALAGFEAFRAIARVNLLQGLLNFPVMIAGTWLFGLPGAVGGMVIAAAGGWRLNRLALHGECKQAGIPLVYRGSTSEWPVLWKFSVPAVLSGALVGPAVWLANTILVNQPGGYGELGLLNAANNWRTLLLFLPGVFGQVALPIMSSVMGTPHQTQDFHKTIDLTQSLALAVVFPVGALLMFASDWVMRLYGSAFTEGSAILIGTVCSAMIGCIEVILGTIIRSQGRMWLVFLISVIWGLGLIGFVIVFAQSWGAKSIAFGMAFSHFLITVFSLLYLSSSVPAGLLIRNFRALAFLILLTLLCYFTASRMRVYLIVPVSLITIFVTISFFIAPSLRRAILDRFLSGYKYLI
jgi:O-antigen/teichoic acid export membrane protein